MEKFISREKLSKKAKRELDKKQRITWGELNPVTKKTDNKKIYNRKKVQKGFDDYSLSEPFNFILYNVIIFLNRGIERTSSLRYDNQSNNFLSIIV